MIYFNKYAGIKGFTELIAKSPQKSERIFSRLTKQIPDSIDISNITRARQQLANERKVIAAQSLIRNINPNVPIKLRFI